MGDCGSVIDKGGWKDFDAAMLRIHRVDGETVRTGPHPKVSISLADDRLVGRISERDEQVAEA